tara:strand:+ start:2028 stop:3614 length:1587 start_codon:yes stop_codon:yes gene_type:complete
MKDLFRFFCFTFIFISFGQGCLLAGGGSDVYDKAPFPVQLSYYSELESEYAIEHSVDQEDLSLMKRLMLRASVDPVNLIATLLFFGAILHTFAAGYFMKLSHKLEEQHKENLCNRNFCYVDGKSPVDFKAKLFHFLGEVEAIFGIWILPLLVVITCYHGWSTAAYYIDSRNFTEPLFVVVIMSIAASRPIITFSEKALSCFAQLGKQSIAAWWISILVVAPLLGSFITEPAAMTIAALLLGQQFYQYKPSEVFKYATIGLLFVNISVGGTLTHFAAPPVLMVATKWEWNVPFMLTNFGWRAFLGIIFATALYYLLFRKEFKNLEESRVQAEDIVSEDPVERTPIWVIGVHLSFLAWTVFTLHHPALFIGGFLMFIAFTIATDHHQNAISLKSPLLVGFFLAGLVTHGGLQAWWIEPVLSMLSEQMLFFGSTILTAFNDNAAITFLASQVPAFDHRLVDDVALAKSLQYAVVAGAVTGGGLTVIANAPNPAGQSLLSRFFKGGVSPLNLLLAALTPTLIMVVVFIVIPN